MWADYDGLRGEFTVKDVIITKGDSAEDVVKMLTEEGFIKFAPIYKIYTKWFGYDGQYKAGTFNLNSHMNYKKIATTLTTAPVIGVKKFTVPEGSELRQIADILQKAEITTAEDFLNVCQTSQFTAYSFLEDLPQRENRLEGYLFPDTYEVEEDEKVSSIVDRMLLRFDNVFKQEYYERAKELGMTVDKIIILASIIEREAVRDDERAIISSVFYNRIKAKEPLQSCATVQYILKERKPILSIEDTQIDSLYNTYIHKGLPVGPIASPGEKSIIAALYPADTKYKFFVSKGTEDGSHVFTKTYDEHLKASTDVENGIIPEQPIYPEDE